MMFHGAPLKAIFLVVIIVSISIILVLIIIIVAIISIVIIRGWIQLRLESGNLGCHLFNILIPFLDGPCLSGHSSEHPQIHARSLSPVLGPPYHCWQNLQSPLPSSLSQLELHSPFPCPLCASDGAACCSYRPG